MPPDPDQSPQPNSVNPLSLTVDELARMLSAGGGGGGRPVTPDDVRADLAAGAPQGPGGRVNLVHYAAWLLREVQAR